MAAGRCAGLAPASRRLRGGQCAGRAAVSARPPLAPRGPSCPCSLFPLYRIRNPTASVGRGTGPGKRAVGAHERSRARGVGSTMMTAFPPRLRPLLLIAAFGLLGSPCWCDERSDAASARSLYNRGAYAEAAALLERLAAKKTADAADLAVLGLCYINLERLPDAERVLSSARALGPSNSLVFIALGTLAFTRKDFDLALDHFERAMRLDPSSEPARNGKVASLVNRGIDLFQSGRTGEARKSFQSALALDARSVPALRNLGIVELKDGNAGRAAELFEQALAASVEDPQILRLLASALESLGDEGRLLQVYRRLAAADPTDADAFARLGALLEKRVGLEEAEPAFERAEALGTVEPYPYLRLAERSIARAEPTVAARRLRQAIGMAVQKASGIQAQAAQDIGERGELDRGGMARLEELSRRLEEPRRVLRESLRLLRSIHREPGGFEADLLDLASWYPQSIDLKAALGGLYEEQGRWQEARILWEDLLARHPTTVEAHLGLARCLERSGALPESAIAWLRALDLAADDPAVYDALERVYRGLGREEDLVNRLLDRSIRDPLNPLLLRRLGLLEREAGRIEESTAHLEQAANLERMMEQPAGAVQSERPAP